MQDLPLIIVVDDEPLVLMDVEAFLEMRGFRVKCFTNPGKAIEFLSHNTADMILTDLNIGIHSGASFIRRLRSEICQDIYVVLMSGIMRSNNREILNHIFECGANNAVPWSMNYIHHDYIYNELIGYHFNANFPDFDRIGTGGDRPTVVVAKALPNADTIRRPNHDHSELFGFIETIEGRGIRVIHLQTIEGLIEYIRSNKPSMIFISRYMYSDSIKAQDNLDYLASHIKCPVVLEEDYQNTIDVNFEKFQSLLTTLISFAPAAVHEIDDDLLKLKHLHV